jgi:hypothetical protein
MTKYFLFLTAAISAFLAQGQICPTQPSGVSVTGWSVQENTDWSGNSLFLDALNPTDQTWSLGSGVSDAGVSKASNSQMQFLLAAHKRNVVAPSDILPFAGGHYVAPTGYSPLSQGSDTPSNLAAWNLIFYADLGVHSFADVSVKAHFDFNPCYTVEESEMFVLDLNASLLSNGFDLSEISRFGTNQNLAANFWSALNASGSVDFDPTAQGYYTFAIEVLDACGNRKLWHDMVVSVLAPGSDNNGNGIADTDESLGCTNPLACNFDCGATQDDDSCDYTSCTGCTVAQACNFNPEATTPNTADCLFPVNIYGSNAYDCDGECLLDSDGDGICNALEVVGCQNQDACNFNASATDSGYCIFPASGLDCDGNCLVDTDSDDVCDGDEVLGCTQVGACNFNSAATEDDESCEFLTCAGCTVVQACNYNAQATISAIETCVYPSGCDTCSGAEDGTGTVVDSDEDNDGVCNALEVVGCQDLGACNFNVAATDAGECDFSCVGCMTESACNYDVNATQPGECIFPLSFRDCNGDCNTDINENGVCDQEEVVGCTDPAAGNYNPLAVYSGSCTFDVPGCNLPWFTSYDPAVTILVVSACFNGTPAPLGSPTPAGMVTGCSDATACNYAPGGNPSLPCDYSCLGCTNPAACDYNEDAIYNTGCSDFTSCYGCTTVGACNYDSDFTFENGTCEFTSCLGCMNVIACNYDASATLSSPGSCTFATGCDSCSGATDGTGTVVDGDVNNNNVCDAVEVVGCTQPLACNYNPSANVSAACDFTSCVGCLDLDACNYEGANPAITLNNLLDCTYPAFAEDCNGVCINDGDSDGVCDELEIEGCQDAAACNYNAAATDAGTCTYAAAGFDCAGNCIQDEDNDGVCDPLEVFGCTTVLSCNYNAAATEDDGSCDFASCVGCGLSNACNYNATAILLDNLTCTYPPAGYDDCDGLICTDVDADGNCDFAEIPSCIGELDAPVFPSMGTVLLSSDPATWATAVSLVGVTDANAVALTFVDAEGRFATGAYMVARTYTATDACGNASTGVQILVADLSQPAGCTEPLAVNYDEDAVNNDGTCSYEPLCPSDLDGDNVVGVNDLLALLSVFGIPCPN